MRIPSSSVSVVASCKNDIFVHDIDVVVIIFVILKLSETIAGPLFNPSFNLIQYQILFHIQLTELITV